MNSYFNNIEKWTPRPYPSHQLMEGRFIRLEPIDIPKHIDGFCNVLIFAPDVPKRFRYLPFNQFKTKEDLLSWLSSERARFLYAIIDKKLEKLVGFISLISIVPEHGSIEIGVYFSDMISKSPGGTEAIYLILRHVFDELKYRRWA